MEIIEMPLEELLLLPVYPTADIFPMLLDEAEPPAGYEGMTIHQFADQILREGVRVPLDLWNGFLLDGRNRREAARLANKATPGSIETVPVRFVSFEDEEEADSWVLSLNIDRRNMNKDQLACLAVRFWEIEAARAKDRQNLGVKITQGQSGRTHEILARRFHVSDSYVKKARSLYLSDRPKFDRAASGRERVIGKSLTVTNTQGDPLVTARTTVINGIATVKTAAKTLADLTEQDSTEYEFIGGKVSALISHIDALFGIEEDE